MSNQTQTDKEIKDELFNVVWDMYKDVHGIRPRHMLQNIERYTIANLEEMIDILGVEIEQQIEEMRTQHAMDELRILATCKSQGIDRETYDRWMKEAETV